MHKGVVDLNHGVSSRLSTPIRQKKGWKGGALLDKSLKKKKLRRLSSVGEKDKLSCARKKQQCESQETEKHEMVEDKHKDSKQSVITKEEEEAAETLFTLAQKLTNTCHKKTSEATLNDAENTNTKMSQKRRPVHVYICHLIKDLQTTESEQLGTVIRSKERDSVNARSNTNPYFQWSTKTLSNQQQYSGCYQNWQNQRHQAMDLLSGPSVEIIESKYIQSPLLQLQQQCIFPSLLATNEGRMKFSVHEKKGGSFLVDSSPPTLELTL